TGSGYQAAILAEVGANVHTIEIIPRLGREAAERLERLGYNNIETRIGDGYAGWPDAAPFDSIIVTAAAPQVPEPLVEQLAPGGRLVIPIGPHRGRQVLNVITKDEDGEATTTQLLGVRFVPLVRDD
ncbi:MAG: protein-L-isoaspartate O-methyltransferase, partial [Maricaulaceae bacterium]